MRVIKQRRFLQERYIGGKMEQRSPYVQCFDKSERPVGVVPKSRLSLMPDGWYYGVVNVHLVRQCRGRIEMCCSWRTNRPEGNDPGKLQSCFGGHIQEGEVPRQAACLEMLEELDYVVDPSQLCLIEKGYSDEFANYTARRYFQTFVCVYRNEGYLTPNPKEISGIEWWPREQYESFVADHRRQCCALCPPRRFEKIRRLLAGERLENCAAAF